MEIKPVKTFENGFMKQTFAFGGEDGMDAFDEDIKYRASIQNYLIDTGDEVILVDTGIPEEMPEQEFDESLMIYNGVKISDYLTAFEKLGYDVDDVTKIIITHKHPDHSGEIAKFPNANVYLSKTEAEALELEGDNIVSVEFNDTYKNFPKAEKIADNIYIIEAIGHTSGNSIVIVENDDLYYMIHGDVTYTDEALYANKLSVVFEDIEKARETMDNIREFIKDNPTVYLSTHTPLGPENLENKYVTDLEKPPKSIFPE
ncbi:MBL fold metallo-hydrolase [Methanobrevibacter sp.]|uniref:MBL fold metallo-hydrolase n=2 Tax=Methanobrevibacter TaxID=2172 RepID=UPI001B055772|nr:MBL fold metallo-hydrolase [Methanobrevibacter sp.]MBQ6344755.1 MBL fold metallo-hydrolase [Methanobrevibacter sp.]MBQ6628143.1 MBL fold metallo-hydrolase [Methanobrevibacter sp.]